MKEKESCLPHNWTCGVWAGENISFTGVIGLNQSPSSSFNLVCRSIVVIKVKGFEGT